MRWTGLWFAILVSCLLNSTEASAVERRLWLWSEQPFLSTETRAGNLRHQINLKGSQFSDVILTSASVQFDFRFLELSLVASEKNFLETSSRTGELLMQYLSEQHFIGAEVARYFVSRYGVYGRLGLQYWHAFPVSQSVVVLGLDTGKFGENWDLHLRSRFHLFTNGAGNLVAINYSMLRNWKPLSVGILVGSSFWLNQHLVTTGSGSKITEAMLFTAGPHLHLNFGRFTLQATAPLFRLWRDNETFGDTTSHPTEFSIGADAKLNIVL